jgi:hypothetical protein
MGKAPRPKFKVNDRVVVKAKLNTFRGVVRKAVLLSDPVVFEYTVRWDDGTTTEVWEWSLKKSLR